MSHAFGLKRWLFLVGLLALAPLCRADGFIIVRDGPVVPNHFSFAPLEVTYHRVTVKIDDQVATTSVDEEFFNPNAVQLEGTYMFPLPDGAGVDKFTMEINGKAVSAELLDAAKAQEIYEETVRKARDPALLEYAGRGALKVRIFPIEANSRKHVTLSYTQVLAADAGLSEYIYPLNTEKFSSRPVGDVSVTVTLNCSTAIANIYSPSHNVDVKRDGACRAVVGYEEQNVRPDADFKLIFTRDAKELGINVLTYEAPGEANGYYMLLAAPAFDAPQHKSPGKDITFVLDTSGSMAGPKIKQAQKALTFCLENLGAEDNFQVIRFSTEAEPLFDALVPATQQNVEKARAEVEGFKATGGTAIDEALKDALALGAGRTGERPYEIVFLTDGMPTVGETSEDAIVADVAHVKNNIRIFCFGIGNDVNTHLLDRIAQQTGAFSQYVLPEEDIELKVSSFYTKVKEPVLMDVQFSVVGDSVHLSQPYPPSLPDLFRGQMLVAFGRYSGNGAAAVKISGTVGGAAREFTADANFTSNDTSHAFIPRLGATRRVGWLLDEIRMHGESAELKDEVVRLAREHGIVTPYTASLIIEDEGRREVPAAAQSFREMSEDKDVRDRAQAIYSTVPAEAADEAQRTGRQAVDNAKSIFDSGSATAVSQVGPASQPALNKTAQAGWMSERGGYKEASNYAQQVTVINGRSFYENGNTWTDSTVQANAAAHRQSISFGSDEYFALLKKHPEAAPWLALGNELDVVIDGTIYEIR